MNQPAPPADLALQPEDIIRLWQACARPAAPLPGGLPARLPPLPGLRGVVFDVYGTLFVSAAGEIGHAGETRNEHCFRDLLVRFGRTPDPRDKRSCLTVWHETIQRHHKRANKRGIIHPEVDIRQVWHETLTRLFERGQIKAPPPEPLIIERLALAFEAAVNPVWPMPGALRAIAALRDAGLLLGIVSNAQFFSPFLFDALLSGSPETLGFPADLCVWSYRLGEAKPAVRLFETLLANAARHGIHDPGDLLYVGNDMLNDIWTASQAGLRTALFAGDRRSLRLRTNDPRCRHLKADATLTNLADLPGWLVARV